MKERHARMALALAVILGACVGGKPERRCPRCDRRLSHDARHCPRCGEDLEDVSRKAEP